MRRHTIAMIVLFLLAGTIGGLWWYLAHRAQPLAERVAPAESVWLDEDLRAIAEFVDAHWRGDERPLPRMLQVSTEGVYVAARAQGRQLARAWGDGESVGQALARALQQIRQDVGAKTKAVDRLEVFVAARAKDVQAIEQKQRLFAHAHRGVVGLEIDSGNKPRRYSPTHVLATNLTHWKVIQRDGKDRGLGPEALSRLRYRFLFGPQFLVKLGPPASAELMERGNRYVPVEQLNRTSVAKFSERMAQWMWNNLHEDGRMTYLYLPSRGREAEKRNNLIRQFMASIALGRIAATEDDPELWDRSAVNIDYNLGRFYRREGEVGLVELRGKVKLGAIALAALAIVEHRDRSRWPKQEAALRRTVQKLWQDDGSFRSFYKPAERNDNQNFYPGEALLLWATLYQQDPDRALLDQFMQSFRYYRSYHLDAAVPDRRNPAFVPWHTQAYFKIWRRTRNDELRDFIFEMNDWLLGIQQWDDVEYRDARGRFYDPQRPFGPPHASSTGVYLEGLIDAYNLARQVGDAKRMTAYKRAIRRGLRSSMQLQFVDEIDMFYVQDKATVRGGLRTKVYDNQIRCDNVQHTLMGILKILASDVLNAPRE